MKKSTLLLSLLLLFLSACAAEKEVYVAKEYGSGSRVAVWDLEDLSVAGPTSLSDMKEFLTARIVETLQEKGGYEVLERQKLILALEELNLGSSELASAGSRLQVGKIMGAQVMVFGGYQLVGEQLRVDLRMVEVETGAIIRAAEQTAAAADLSGWLKVAEQAALQLL